MSALSVIVPYRNGERWIDRLLATVPRELDVLVVDDQSDTPLRSVKRPGTEIVRTPQRGYWAGACNYGARLRPGRDLLFLNQDLEFVQRGWLDALAALPPAVEIAGNWVRGHPAWPQGYVDGVFMFVRRTAWDRVGGMDAARYPMWGSSCLLQAQICRTGGRAQPIAATYWKHHRQGNLGDSFRQALYEEVGHLHNDGNAYRRVPPYIVAVICAHGDYEKYLPDAVESIRRQTRADWQIVISLDGNASPALREMARAYVDPWAGIAYVQQPDGTQGPPAVRNAGVAAAKTRYYILMMDGDDTAEPDAMDVMVTAAEQHPNTMIYGDLRWIGDRQGIRRFPDYDYPALLERNYIPSFTLYPLAMWKAVGGYPAFMSPGWDDYGYNIACGRGGWCGYHVRAIVFNYRRHGHSRNHNSQKIRAQLRDLLEGHYPDVFARRFPMGCCGGKARSAPAGAPRRTARARRTTLPAGVGAEGMVEVRYLGNLGAAFIIRGQRTRVQYKVRKGWTGWMDARDAAALMRTSREYEYTGRASGGGKVLEAPAPTAAPSVLAAEVPPMAETPPLPTDANSPGIYCDVPGCHAGPFKSERGLETHKRLRHRNALQAQE